MTNQEAIKIIEDECEHIKSHLKCKGKAEEYYKELGDMCIAFYMAINALEQEPSGDLISRQAVIEICNEEWDSDLLVERIEQLPSVNPQEPKTGHWIDDNEEIDAQYGRHLYKCSECNEYADMFVGGAEDWWDIEKPNYCPNCGCRMVEPQERSDKE